jgi:hypothetical protein
MVLSLCSFSCIPIRIAPSIEDHKIVRAKKFKRDLPRLYAFVFEDTKDADEFYYFINSKYDLGFRHVESNVPIEIGNHIFFMSFYEREKTSQYVNLIPMVVDGVLNSEGVDPMLEDMYSIRKGHWYIAITVDDPQFKDALSPDHEYRKEVIQYLDNLREEYFRTHHYLELTLKN